MFLVEFSFQKVFSTAPSSTIQERQPRAPVKLKPVRVPSKDRKPKPVDAAESKMVKTTKGKIGLEDKSLKYVLLDFIIALQKSLLCEISFYTNKTVSG